MLNADKTMNTNFHLRYFTIEVIFFTNTVAPRVRSFLERSHLQCDRHDMIKTIEKGFSSN